MSTDAPYQPPTPATTELPSQIMRPQIAVPDPCFYDEEYSGKNLPPYLVAIEQSGGEAIVINSRMTFEHIVREISWCSGVLLTSCRRDVDPQKYGATKHSLTAKPDPFREILDELLLQHCYRKRKPLFAVCYGLQSLNVWRGGTLVQHIESKINHGANHDVNIKAGSALAEAMGRCVISVNSSHHQAVATAGDALRVTAFSDDGIIEALEGTAPEHYVLGVQWHPERDFASNEDSRKLFAHFIKAVQNYGRSVTLPSPGVSRKIGERDDEPDSGRKVLLRSAAK